MKIINRLIEYLENKGVKPTKFEKEIGLSNGYLGKQRERNADFGESIIRKIIDNSPELNIEWLITGKGAMLKSLKEDDIDNEDKRLLIDFLKKENAELKKEIERLKMFQNDIHTQHKS